MSWLHLKKLDYIIIIVFNYSSVARSVQAEWMHHILSFCRSISKIFSLRFFLQMNPLVEQRIHLDNERGRVIQNPGIIILGGCERHQVTVSYVTMTVTTITFLHFDACINWVVNLYKLAAHPKSIQFIATTDNFCYFVLLLLYYYDAPLIIAYCRKKILYLWLQKAVWVLLTPVMVNSLIIAT